MKFETLAVHAAQRPDPVTGAVAAPIYLSTTYARHPSGELIGDFAYIRDQNPNRRSLEQALVQLEAGQAAAVFSSGLAALHMVLQLLQPGDHVIAPADVYHGTADLLREARRWGLQTSFVEMSDRNALQAALQSNTRLVFAETPSNPMLKITDIAAVAEICDRSSARLVVDNTWATPALQRPLELGAHIVMHASTKYFGGHSDVLGGALIAREADDFFGRVPELLKTTGAVPSPFDCWLIRRGLTTLPVRIRAQSASAAQIAAFLNGHSAIEQVHYPGLPGHAGHAVARKQMQAFGAMLSFQLRGGEPAAAQTASRLQIFTRATSLGSVESLIEHRFAVEGPHSRTPRNLLRISVGLEHPDDLIEDLDQAMDGL